MLVARVHVRRPLSAHSLASMKMPVHSFELKSPSDILGKARRELGRLEHAYTTFEENQFVSDHGLNFAITAWHIADWVWKTYNPNNKRNLQALGLGKFDDFHNLIRKKSEALAICYEIATGSKHMKLEKDSKHIRRVEDTGVSAGASTIASNPFRVLKVELPSGERKRAEEIFREATNYWEEFFGKYNIS